MKHPEDPRLWQGHLDRASSRLPSNLADNVLRQVRLERAAEPARKSGFFPFVLSAGTAAACLFAAVAIHGQVTKVANERHLAEWQQLAADLDTLNDL